MDKFIQGSLFTKKAKSDLFLYENRLYEEGYNLIAGIDEAGRGPLAGPVVAAAVILPEIIELPGVNDSKKLSAEKRELLFDDISNKAIAIGIGYSEPEEIDCINILQATLKAMKRAVVALDEQAEYLLIDGINTIDMALPQEAVKKGDSLSLSIASASIIAKVTRDRIMKKYDLSYPEFGFSSHKGYGSKKHIEAIIAHGPSPIHRKSFARVREYVK